MKNIRKILKIFAIIVVFTIFFFINKSKPSNLKTDKTCGRFPEEKHITYDNVVWQVLELSEKRLMKIMNAYLDERQNQTVVRVNVMSPKLDIEKDSIFCQFWYETDPEPLVVEATKYVSLWWALTKESLKFQLPYFIECSIPNSVENLPSSVSLVSNPCDYAENNLKIINNQPVDGVKKKFAVCSKAATYTDPEFAIRFIEWVHWMQILGAEKIYFSYRYLHPKIFKAVKFFESQGVVETWPYYEPSGVNHDETLEQTFLMEENSHNDCFYRVRTLYEYVAILDFDEIIVPKDKFDRNWDDLLEKINASAYDSVSFGVFLIAKNDSKADEIPKNLYTLRNNNFYWKTKGPGKSIFKTENLYIVNTHTSMACLSGKCQVLKVQPSIAKVFHYRDDVKSRENYSVERDESVLNFKDQLIQRVSETLRDLKRKK